MEIIKFLVVSIDADYGEAICKCARNLDINVSFSYTDKLEGNWNSYSMVIFDGFKKEQLKDIEKKLKCPCCYLTENESKEKLPPKRGESREGKGRGQQGKKLFVYKYKMVTKVLSDLMDIYTYYTGNSMGSVFSGINSCKLYTVTSSIGGVGATSIAMGLAQDMAFAGGNKTLYMSLGEYHQELNFSRGHNGKNLREYLYDFFYGNDKYCENIQSYLIKLKDNLYMFNVTGGLSQFSTINDKQFLEFINYLVAKNFFDRIIVDIGTNLRDKWNSVYKLASCNILINSLMDSWYQEQFWMDYYKKIGEINEKSLVVENRFVSENIVKDNPLTACEGDAIDSQNVNETIIEEKEKSAVDKVKDGAGKLADYLNSFNSNWAAISRELDPVVEKNDHVVISRKKKQNKIRIPEDNEAFMRNDGFLNISLDSKFGQGVREMIMALADVNKIN